MIKVFIIILFFIFNSCSTFKKEPTKCPKLIAPKKAAEIVVYSENKIPVYLGIRGVQKFCFKDGDDIDISSFSGPDTLTINTTALGASAGTTITHNSHGLSTGDKVIYTAGGTALNNLTSGQTYYVIKNNIQVSCNY